MPPMYLALPFFRWAARGQVDRGAGGTDDEERAKDLSRGSRISTTRMNRQPISRAASRPARVPQKTAQTEEHAYDA